MTVIGSILSSFEDFSRDYAPHPQVFEFSDFIDVSYKGIYSKLKIFDRREVSYSGRKVLEVLVGLPDYVTTPTTDDDIEELGQSLFSSLGLSEFTIITDSDTRVFFKDGSRLIVLKSLL